MIDESNWWKADLLRRAKEIRRRCRLKRWSQASQSGLELDVMVSCYVMRKLFEAKAAVSSRLPGSPIAVYEIPRKPDVRRLRLTDRFDWSRFFEFSFDVSREVRLRDLCNSIIHSFVFSYVVEEPWTVTHFIFGSEWDVHRNGKIFVTEAPTFIGACETVGQSWPVSVRMDRTGPKEIVEAFDQHDVVANGMTEEFDTSWTTLLDKS